MLVVGEDVSIKQLTVDDDVKNHWAIGIFNRLDSVTRLPRSSERGDCFDESQVGIKAILKEQGFKIILQLAFENEPDRSFNVGFHLRARDHRARIVCKIKDRTGPNQYFCLPLNMLEIDREGSCLRLCRRRNSNTELVLWARIPFTSMECMVLTFCTFLALRSEDGGRPVDDIRDYELDGEEELYGG
ncbi:hypothetical protein N7493_001507 [Penicillium malachiteum]|uniref:PH domain-containing protein n=1 Tax=Penicillium malachiteum TaxID=1324776 RepID=A0AAD6HUB1_9EURO|nr:hypothetical protein N7493_001507 [Penicillium malachiteum]